jgi:succinate dehydrogenase / fumarate reductase cytochrome b subunit
MGACAAGDKVVDRSRLSRIPAPRHAALHSAPSLITSLIRSIFGFRPMTNTATPSRPLSPHLQIYRWPITMVVSIAHRVTGAALYFGTLLLVWLLVAAAASEHAYDLASAVFGSILGRLVLFGYTWALLHHMLGGIRHFVWDMGKGMEAGVRETIAWANIAGSIALTLIVWAIALVWR